MGYIENMRKKVFGRKLSRDRGSREALFRSLVKAFVEHGVMVTTKAKAKAVQPMIENLVSAAKTKNVAVVRRVSAFLANDKKTVGNLFGKIAEVFKNRNGGFTKITNLPRRLGDFAEMVRIEWSEKVELIDDKKITDKKEKALKKTEKKEQKQSLRSRVTKLIGSKK